ncbi:hypothetical protein G7Z17_g5038 [Cylindrodendrum hubeiense]|uniref:Protein kinase domain-containing protein n=1 Tax=Cylindrodendrum hubeiense TaxID=595255 RepID=A0A9P5H7H1_9HYPO|nr:hypothetical protein G7Z17_g5038 [Cylindrodendrum hubeiense]
MTQTSSHSILDEFRAHLRSEEVCRQNYEDKAFYRPESIKSWLSARPEGSSNAAKLIGAVFAPNQSFVPVMADHILDSYPLVFTILADMDCGHMIRAFKSMPDSYLTMSDPFSIYNSIMDTMAKERLKVPVRYNKGGYQAVIDAFDKHRWAFVPVPLRLKMDAIICQGKCILPFFYMDMINEGGTAKVYHCKIQADLVEEELAKTLGPSEKHDPKLGKYYELAIKSYKEGFDDIHNIESNAFKGMQRQEGLGVVKYLGEYQTSGEEPRHHIMLEYGEQDLDEYLAETFPPVLNKEIIAFWESMFKVAHTLERIHRLKHKGEDGNMQLFNGWHGDIKPENILHVRREFKLADFGFSKFEKFENNKSTTPLLGGTRTYGKNYFWKMKPTTDVLGAPERDNKRHQGVNVPQSQTIDTWSFGCVLSAVATWVILGKSLYLLYGTIREQAIKELYRRRLDNPGITVPDCADAFHDGNNVLGAVLEWHDHLRNSSRRADTISSRVLDLVDSGMLVDGPERRLTSAQLCESLDEIITVAKADYESSVESGALKKESEGTLKVLLKLDENAPVIPKSFSQAGKDNNSNTNVITLKPPHEQDSALPHLRPSNRVRKSERVGKIVFGKTANRERVIRSDSRISDLSSHSETVTSRKSSNGFQQPSSYIELEATQPKATAKRVDIPLPYLHIDPHATRKEPNEPYSPVYQTPDSYGHLQGFRDESFSPTLQHKPPITAVETKYKQLMESWNSKSYWNKIPKDKYLEHHIFKRDIKFVVDNAASMKSHWPNVQMTLLALAMMIGPLDKDGLDLLYTIGERHALDNVKGWKIESKFRQSMEEAGADIDDRNQTDMAATLSIIFDDYVKDFSKKQTLIILTDGLWEGSGLKDDVENVICDFINDLKTRLGRLERRWFSIQFVSFGNNDKALNRLQALDDHLKAREDVVDTKHWDFPDVNKLILGSITQGGDEATPLSTPSTPVTPTSPQPSPPSAKKRKSLVADLFKSERFKS